MAYFGNRQRVCIDAKNAVALLKKINQVAATATAGIQDLHSRHNAGSEQLIKKININGSELLTNLGHEYSMIRACAEALQRASSLRIETKMTTAVMARPRGTRVLHPGTFA